MGSGKYPAYITGVLYYEKAVQEDHRTACITQDGEDRKTLQNIRLTLRGRAKGTLYVTCRSVSAVFPVPWGKELRSAGIYAGVKDFLFSVPEV